jgi:hypothetical protein
MYNLLAFALLFVAADTHVEIGDQKVKLYSNETNNFEILSNHEGKSEYLSQHVEFMKESIFKRWGFDDIKFSRKCMVICIDNKDLYKKFFNLDKSVYRASLIHDGKDISVIWTCVDGDWRDSDLSEKLTEACLREYEIANKIKFPKWMITGISVLNGSESDIYETLMQAEDMLKDEHCTADEILQQDVNSKNIDKWNRVQSTMLCLFLKKEFPAKDMESFCAMGPLQVVKEYYGFSSYEEFNHQFEKYVFDLSHDMKSGKTPKKYYLDIYSPLY